MVIDPFEIGLDLYGQRGPQARVFEIIDHPDVAGALFKDALHQDCALFGQVEAKQCVVISGHGGFCRAHNAFNELEAAIRAVVHRSAAALKIKRDDFDRTVI